MVLTQVSKQITTLAPDNSGVKTFIESAGSWADGEHRMAEKKRIILEYTSDTALDDWDIFVNPALFLPEGYINTITDKGSYYYACKYQPTTGIEYTMTLQTNLFPSYLPTMQNYEVKLIPDGSNSFQIIVDFYMIASQAGYLSPTSNRHKLLKDWWNNPQEVLPDNSNLSAFSVPNIVYGTAGYSPRVYIYMEKQPYFLVDFYRIEEKFPGFGAGFYNRNKYNAERWFTNTNFKLMRDGNEVFNLADYRATECEIYANTDAAVNEVTNFFVMIIRTDKNDDSVNFLQNYEADFQEIKVSNVSTGKIQAPMSDPNEITPQQWKASFNISPLPYGAKFRLIGIVYSNVYGEDYKVNSFISGEYTVDAVPNYIGNGFTARASLDDYNKQFEGNDLECCIEERMRSKIKLDFPFNQWKNDIYERLGIVTTNDIRRYLTKIKVEIFEEYFDTINALGTVKNIFDLKISNKTGVNQYGAQNGLTLDFGSNWAEFTYEWRNRFESNLPNLQSLINGSNTLPVLSNQYWGGKTLKIRWTLSFYYDNYIHPFTDEIVFNQQMRVKDYGDMSVKGINENTMEFEDMQYMCDDNEVCFAGVLNEALEGYKLITNITPLNSSIDNLEEAEVWEGSQLPELSTNKIVNQDEDYTSMFSETAAKFCVDGSKLIVNSQYQLSALAKKYYEPRIRIIESGELRITENKNQRTND